MTTIAAMGTTTTVRTAATTAAKTGTAAVTTGSRHNARVPRFPLARRIGPLGTALTLWDIWRRLPPRQRRFLVEQTRKHGPRLAKQAATAARNRRRP